MDYEKKIREYLNNNEVDELYKSMLLNLFPELKESEGEKIRKALIKLVQHIENDELCCNYGYSKNNFLSWLEKQGEQKPNPYNGISFEYNGHIWGMCARDNGVDISCDKHLIKHLEKQDKQKPKENKGNLGGISANSAWSEEDEQRLNSCLNILQPKTFVGNTETINTKWLKSLKDRVQPKQEWSEEDDYYRNCIIQIIEEINNAPLKRREDWDAYITWLKSFRPQNNITDEELAQAKKNAYNDALDKIEYRSGEPTFDDGWNAAIDYIRKKSLRPQNRWRPSEEQMIALKDALNDAIWKYDFKGSPIKEEVTRKHAETIESLYNDLKKLREE